MQCKQRADQQGGMAMVIVMLWLSIMMLLVSSGAEQMYTTQQLMSAYLNYQRAFYLASVSQEQVMTMITHKQMHEQTRAYTIDIQPVPQLYAQTVKCYRISQQSQYLSARVSLRFVGCIDDKGQFSLRRWQQVSDE